MEKILTANNALDENDLDQTARLVAEVEAELLSVTDQELTLDVRANIGGVMIDLGTASRDEGMIIRGTNYTEYALAQAQSPEERVLWLYNAANGHSALWIIRRQRCFGTGVIDTSHISAKAFYREAIILLDTLPGLAPPELRKELLVNYANTLDSVGRSVEAFAFYDRALSIDPTMGMALGNKAITLHSLAGLAHGHTHQFMLTARELFTQAIQRPLFEPVRSTFREHLSAIDEFIGRHNEFKPVSQFDKTDHGPFHQFLREFCARHGLYLTPTTVLSKPEWAVYGDPLYITHMQAALDDDTKFDRCITFLNQIKQDYVLARYFLVQSQYRTEVIDTIDQEVVLYYPLDYSLHSAYIQLLKVAFRLAIDVLDKIALFIRDYFKVKSISEERVNFRSIWTDASLSSTLRPELASKQNWFLLCMFDLALDLRKGGAYEWMYQQRNILTHRFLGLHEIVVPSQREGDIPREHVDKFILDCIAAMQVARAAVMYLILAVDFEEGRTARGGRLGVLRGMPVDDAFRWRPHIGS